MERKFSNGVAVVQNAEYYLRLPWILLKSGMSVNAILLLSFGLTRPENWMFTFEGTGKILFRDFRWVRRHFNEIAAMGYVRRTLREYSPRVYYYEFADSPMFFDDEYCVTKRIRFELKKRLTKSEGLKDVPRKEDEKGLYQQQTMEDTRTESVEEMTNRGTQTEGLKSESVSRDIEKLDREDEKEEREILSSFSSGFDERLFRRNKKKLEKSNQLDFVGLAFDVIWNKQREFKERWRAELEVDYEKFFKLFVCRWCQGYTGEENWVQAFETLTGDYTEHWQGIDKFTLSWILEMFDKRTGQKHWNRVCADVKERRQKTTETMMLVATIENELVGFHNGITEHRNIGRQCVKSFNELEKRRDRSRGKKKKDFDRELGIAHARIEEEKEWVRYFQEIIKETTKKRIDFINMVKEGLTEAQAMRKLRKIRYKVIQSPSQLEKGKAKVYDKSN